MASRDDAGATLIDNEHPHPTKAPPPPTPREKVLDPS